MRTYLFIMIIIIIILHMHIIFFTIIISISKKQQHHPIIIRNNNNVLLYMTKMRKILLCVLCVIKCLGKLRSQYSSFLAITPCLIFRGFKSLMSSPRKFLFSEAHFTTKKNFVHNHYDYDYIYQIIHLFCNILS